MLRLSLQAVMGLSSKPLRLLLLRPFLWGGILLVIRRVRDLSVGSRQGCAGLDLGDRYGHLLGARQLVSIGVVGEYLARVYDQSRGIPRYVIVEDD